MQDFIPIGTGNSRYLKSVENFKTLYPTYDAFAAALVAGTLPVDFNGINEAGVLQKGMALNKYNLLKDATAALFGLSGSAVPDDVFAAIKPLINAANTNANSRAKITQGSYVGTGTYGESNPNTLTFDFIPKFVLVLCEDSSFHKALIMLNPSRYGICSAGSSGYYPVTWSAKTVSWYYDGGTGGEVLQQMNSDKKTYHYTAIG